MNRLTVLHTGDVRGVVMPEDVDGNSCTLAQINDNSTICLGGVARIIGYVKSIRAVNNATVLLDPTNYFFGFVRSFLCLTSSMSSFLISLLFLIVTFGFQYLVVPHNKNIFLHRAIQHGIHLDYSLHSSW
jgi:hypothetical protein